MSSEALTIQPSFDPYEPGLSLDRINAHLPVHAAWLKGTVFGDMQSRIKGAGTDIDGIRPYEFGDDTRHIDWAATAKDENNWPQLREHYMDITPNLYVVSDILSPRNNTDTEQPHTKQSLGLAAILSVMNIANSTVMPSRLIATDGNRLIIPERSPRSGRHHLLNTANILSREALVSAPNEEKHTLADLLHFVGRSASRSVVLVVSDFRAESMSGQDEFNWGRALKSLKAKHNDILAVEITAPRDFHIQPNTSLFRHTGTNQVTPEYDKDLRREYALGAQKRQNRVDKALSDAQARHIKLSTSDPQWLTSFTSGLRSVQ